MYVSDFLRPASVYVSYHRISRATSARYHCVSNIIHVVSTVTIGLNCLYISIGIVFEGCTSEYYSANRNLLPEVDCYPSPVCGRVDDESIAASASF